MPDLLGLVARLILCKWPLILYHFQDELSFSFNQNCPDVSVTPERAGTGSESDTKGTEPRPSTPDPRKPTNPGHKSICSGFRGDDSDSNSKGIIASGSKGNTDLGMGATKGDLNASPKLTREDVLNAALERMSAELISRTRHPPIVQQLGGSSIGPRIPKTVWTYRRAKSFKNKPPKKQHDGSDESSTDEDEIGMCISTIRALNDTPEPDIQQVFACTVISVGTVLSLAYRMANCARFERKFRSKTSTKTPGWVT